MKIVLKPIALNERSYYVNLLHKALKALGLPVAKKEVSRGRAGQDTLKKVRTLQAQLNVPVDESVLVDEASIRAIASVLDERDLTDASRSFEVSGKVKFAGGEVKKRQKLLAFDIDLRGAAVYRTIQSLTDLQENEGFEFLGTAVSDNLGNYQITFYDWQYRQAERNKADVVVFAYRDNDIIGRSRAVNSEDYSDKGLVRNLDVFIEREDERTEYAVLMGQLAPFLRESKTTLAEIAGSWDQLIFTANELDVDLSHLGIAAGAELLLAQEEAQLSHELLYGIGRQNISISWPSLYLAQEDQLRGAITNSVAERIIQEFSEEEITSFVHEILERAAKHQLDEEEALEGNTLNVMLKNALPDENQRISFVNALGNFEGSDFQEFWEEHLPAQPEFRDKPELIASLLLTQELTLLSGNHQALVTELQVNRGVTATPELMDLTKDDWLEIVAETGVPDFIAGENDQEKAENYVGQIEILLNAAFPTQRIARMVTNHELPIERSSVQNSIATFLNQNESFDFDGSRIHDFKKEIATAAPQNQAEIRAELMKIQRVFQVSTSPEAMKALMENDLHSAYTIAGIPRRSFINTYAEALGGENAAFAIHQRASHISTRAEMITTHLMEYSHGLLPKSVMDEDEYEKAMAVIEKNFPNPSPNYEKLFGSPDICECKHCRSVYSPAAYFVDLLRFLWRGQPNGNGDTPLKIVSERRPDLLHLPLTCENTNTVLPYIDLTNEVMEYYTAHDSLAQFKGYDTGKTTAQELRANPQNFISEAYSKLKDAVYPFTLPYHQPLDVIRTYSNHLKVSRYKAMQVMNPQPNPTDARAIAAEALGISQEEYIILTGEAFDGTADTTSLHEYFGYQTATAFSGMQNEKDAKKDPRGIRPLLERTGLAYTDLVELVKTLFINPYQGTLFFLEKLFSSSSLGATTIYNKLTQIESGALDAANDQDIVNALNAYNKVYGTTITPAEFDTWVTKNFAHFKQVITLYEPKSKCALDTTKLRTTQSIYEALNSEGITDAVWTKLHRFIRLWRILDWTIRDADLMLAALGEQSITPDTVSKLESVLLLKKATKLPLNQLAVLWGNIETSGEKSLYKKLFLNKAVQRIDKAFKADAWGDYLQDKTEKLSDHQSAVLAAFRITEKELKAILHVARVIDGGNLTGYLTPAGDLASARDVLDLANLSTIYRHVVLAKALKMRVTDLCKLITLFKASPFSAWDIQQKKYVDIFPDKTYEFYKLTEATKKAGFKAEALEYIFEGELPADSTIGLDADKTRQTARAIRDAFAAIEQDHPDEPAAPLTADILAAKLSLTFQPAIVAQFMDILQGTASFTATADKNLNTKIPTNLAERFTYIKKSGRLVFTGIMSDAEQLVLDGLSNNASFKNAVKKMYDAPATFISDNFDGVFSNLADANIVLFDRPAQGSTAADLDDKLVYVYKHFLPLLKSKLRKDAITQHIAALIGLSEEATALLIAGDIDQLNSDLSTEGFSANYFSDAAWGTSAQKKIDSDIDFSWGLNAPDPTVPADKFSVRWQTYIAAPASGKYTLDVEVEEADELFKLYLDDTQLLEKTSAEAATSWSIDDVDLNAAKMHMLTLEYAEVTQNAGIKLQWKTATTALETIPSSVAYPKSILDDFTETATTYHRAAKFISTFKMSETELNHFINYKADFDNIDFKKLEAGHWQRIYDYMTLRNAAPQAQALLTDVFVQANTKKPALTAKAPSDLLHLAMAWDEANLDFLINHFALDIYQDFKNEIVLKRLNEVMQIVSKTGISAQTVVEWGAVETDFKNLNDMAQLIKNTVKAKYEEDDWLDLAGNLSDGIRENQKQALISYLLTRPAIQKGGAKDADSLFEYLLIDVQMSACMDTSRIVQANAALQMFVNRCLLNLEKEVSPEAIDKDRREWMENYRVWEANRKVFLYPENWLEPEWRNDRSEFFRDLESYLVQNDITDRSVEQAFRNYLTSLSEVANLELCGMYQEHDDFGKLKFLHVFSRTHNVPYKFYYRRWDKYQTWSAWEKVQLDIRSVEDGDNSGVHLIPVVWRNRLFLFWPEFREVQETPSANDKEPIDKMATKTVAKLEAERSLEIKLAWSEYVADKWTPKQVSKEIITKEIDASDDGLMSSYQWVVDASDTSDQMNIWLMNIENKPVGRFRVYGGGSVIEKDDTYVALPSNIKPPYTNHFMKNRRDSALKIKGNFYLENSLLHELLYSNDFQYPPKPCLDYPFFYYDAENRRTYFARPVDVTIIEGIRNSGKNKPYIPQIKADVYDFSRPINLADSIPRLTYSASAATAATTTAAAMAVATTAANSNKSVLADFGVQMADVNKPFASVSDLAYETEIQWTTKTYKGLEFHTFHHPYSNTYVTRLNKKGLTSLMKSDTELASDKGVTFEKYKPNFKKGLVKEHVKFDTPPDPRTAYKENVCFDVYGANSIYNWELFFHAPLYIATKLSKNGKYKEAMKWFHYIFDPTTDEMPKAGASEISRYWKVLPFKTTPAKSLEDWFRSLSPNSDPTSEKRVIEQWRDNPFEPHLVASNRPLAYMKHVVIKYVENLIAWGDYLFRQFTRESVYKALQIYVIANHIMGPKPQFVPKRGEVKAESYESLKNKWDDFSNALVELENIFPFSSEIKVGSSSSGPNLLGVGSALYFCIPANEDLLDLWDTAADRLFKIRHCQDIDGVERKLALFAPPISPAALIQAVSQGLSLGSILADLSSPPPIYRFSFLMQKVNEFCADVKGLGSALLAALEKKDTEELSRLRASHETEMLKQMTGIRERHVLDAKINKENLLKARESAQFKLNYYLGNLANKSVTVPIAPTISANLTADSQLPPDTSFAKIEPDVDVSPVKSDKSGVKLIAREQRELDLSQQASDDLSSNLEAEIVAGFMGLIPQIAGRGTPLGVGAGVDFGGRALGWFAGSMAKMYAISSSQRSLAAAKAGKISTYIRREQDWAMQANMAAKEIIMLDKQITSADIRIQVAKKELENHKKQIENAKEVELFLKDKFSNQELYQWMKERLFAVYKQSYNLAFDMAKKAEKAYKYELGLETASFIQYGYWENSRQGLVAGEKLQLALRQLEKSYLEKNRRELELTKSVSLALLNPLELIKLRETGKCYVALPEELFDLDFQGHYFRRIRSVSLSIPCVVGPYTTMNCSLRLMKNAIRINTSLKGNYEHNNDAGLWTDDKRFRSSNVPVTSIATSTGQNDAGMFEFNFRDERYLPFEGAGVISDWQIELSTEENLQQFDYATISDVILHIKYTARESGGKFRQAAAKYIKDFLENTDELSDQPLMRMFSMKHEFPNEWHKFLYPTPDDAEHILNITLGKEHFPFFTHHRSINVKQIDVLAKTTKSGNYDLIISATDKEAPPDNNVMTSTQKISMPQSATYGDLQKATLTGTSTPGIDIEKVSVNGPLSLKLKHNQAVNYTILDTDNNEIIDIFIVLHYYLSD